jgi:hypothetical protein
VPSVEALVAGLVEDAGVSPLVAVLVDVAAED